MTHLIGILIGFTHY